MSATTEDQIRLDLEYVLASLLDAEEHWRCAALRLTQRMRTLDEAEILAELNAGRVAIVNAKTGIAKLHPDRLVR
jgi:hypothetical protein